MPLVEREAVTLGRMVQDAPRGWPVRVHRCSCCVHMYSFTKVYVSIHVCMYASRAVCLFLFWQCCLMSLSMLDGLALCKSCTVPMVLSFIPEVLLFVLTVCLPILMVGPVILTVFFLTLPAGEGGAKGERIWSFFLFSWLGGGASSYFPSLGRRRGKQGGWGAGWYA